jgi:DNA-binding response OmpR family regulator
MKPTLLIADGDAELCELYEMFLGESGYEVETVSGGVDCVRRLRRCTPDLLVLDLDLLWGGGDGVLEWLFEIDPSHRVPVILTSSAGDPCALIRELEPPVVDLLAKPFPVTRLLESVRSALARSTRKATPKKPRCPDHSELFIG